MAATSFFFIYLPNGFISRILLTSVKKNQSCLIDLLREKLNKESVARLKENKKVYEDLKEMSEVLNKHFMHICASIPVY